MVKKRKIPERMCVGCREKKPKRELLRIVRSPENDIDLDFTGKKSGRGAYICYDTSCFLQAKKSRAVEKALKTSIETAVWDNLNELLETKMEREK